MVTACVIFIIFSVELILDLLNFSVRLGPKLCSVYHLSDTHHLCNLSWNLTGNNPVKLPVNIYVVWKMTAILNFWIRKHVFINLIMFHTHTFMKMNRITSTQTSSISGCLFLYKKDNITDSSIAQIHAKYLSNSDLSTFSFPLLRRRNMLACNS